MTPPRCYLEIVGDMIVAKHAIGRERLEDTSVGYPSVPPSWVVVDLATYQTVWPRWIRLPNGTYRPPPDRPRRPDTPEERLARLEARVRVLEQGR